MAGGSVSSGVSTYSNTLAAATVDTVTFADRYGYVLVENTGTGTINVTADGSTPASSGAGSGVAVAAGTSVVIANGLKLWNQVSNVTIAGTTQYPTGSGVTTATPNGQPGGTQPYMSSLAGKAANPGTTVKLISAGTPSYTVSGTG
jgi:hypothetical protein